MSSVKYNGEAESLHYGYRPHIDHEVVIAEKGPPLSNNYTTIPGGCHFFNGRAYLPGRNKLAFFDINGTP